MNEYRLPKINDDVFYVSYGTPKGEYASKDVAAKVTQVNDNSDGLGSIGIFVMNPQGIFWNLDVKRDDEGTPGHWHF